MEEKQERKEYARNYKHKIESERNLFFEFKKLIQKVELQLENNDLKDITKNIAIINSLKNKLDISNTQYLLKIEFFNLAIKTIKYKGENPYDEVQGFISKSKNNNHIKYFAEKFKKYNQLDKAYKLFVLFEKENNLIKNYLDLESTKIELQILKQNKNDFCFKHLTELKIDKNQKVEVYSLYDYFPKITTEYKYFMEDDSNNFKIYSFKNGRYSYVLNTLIKALKKNGVFELLYSKANWSLQIIPSSTVSKTNLRFQNFCNELSNLMQITNGFSAITSENRIQYKGLKNTDKTEYLHFNKALINGKNILLCDDVITSGESYIQICNKLKSYGALTIIGLTIGKTIIPFRKQSQS